MMKTPIYDFLLEYQRSDAVRLHMPGHKGKGPLPEISSLDITEITGADSLFEANGIIAESEECASAIFGCKTLYSTEGSSLAIRAMLHLAAAYAAEGGERPLILAGRNAHRAFLSAAALIDFDIEWIYGGDSYLCCDIRPEDIRARLLSGKRMPAAVYITSPDYLGNIADIRKIAEACHDFGVLLLVDNAHGAYLKFLPESLHPMDLGADMCAASAHKTLPVLTGGAYLHLSEKIPESISSTAKQVMALYGSTSPSYLTLASLDLANSIDYNLDSVVSTAEMLKKKISALGIALVGCEPLKITLAPKSYGYTGFELSEYLEANNISPEFCDPDFTVLMLSPNTTAKDAERLLCALEALPQAAPINSAPPKITAPKAQISPRDAVYSPSEVISVSCAEGRILSAVTVGCPPAVPIVVSGEIISADAVRSMDYYGTKFVSVVK